MSDEIDKQDEREVILQQARVAECRLKSKADNVPFIEGDCEVCADHMPRLVQVEHPKDGPCWACTRCRDNYKLPLIKR